MDCVFPPNSRFLTASKDTPSKIFGSPIQPESHLCSCKGDFKEPENIQQLKSREMLLPLKNMLGLLMAGMKLSKKY